MEAEGDPKETFKVREVLVAFVAPVQTQLIRAVFSPSQREDGSLLFGSVKEGRIKLLRSPEETELCVYYSCTLITVSSSSFWNITIRHLWLSGCQHMSSNLFQRETS